MRWCVLFAFAVTAFGQAGMGPYFVSVQAEAATGLHNVKAGATETRLQREWPVSLNVDSSLPDSRLVLINAAGEAIQTLALEPDADSPGRFQGVFTPQVKNFRIAVQSRDENGNTIQRVDPRLFEARTEVR